MAYTYTGYARYRTLKVKKETYTQTYDLCAGFEQVGGGEPYPDITTRELALLPEEEWKKRVEDFVEHVYALEPGLRADCPDIVAGAKEHNPKMCPVGGIADDDQREQETNTNS